MGDRRQGTVGRRSEDKIRANWHRFEWPAYERDTSRLRMLEHGAYMVLLREYYTTQAPLVANVQQLMYVCRAITEDECAAVEQVLAQFFVLKDDGYHNERCDEEIARANELCEKRQVAGHKGGEANAQRLLKREDKNRKDNNNPPKVPPGGDAKDSRHFPIRENIQALFEQRFKMLCPWDKSEAKALDRLLESNPSWSVQDIGRMIMNRFDSDGVTGTRPRVWLPRLTDYLAGPLDRYGKARSNGNGKQSDAWETADRRVAQKLGETD